MNTEIRNLVDTIIRETRPGANTRERIGAVLNLINSYKADLVSVYTKSEVTDMINEVKSLAVTGSEFIGSVTPATEFPEEGDIWAFADPGTYPDASGTVIPEDSLGILSRVDDIWSSIVITIPQPSQSIPKFADLDFPAAAGDQAIYVTGSDIGYWRVKTGQTATISDIPSDISTIWERIGEKLTIDETTTTVRKSDTYTGAEQFTNAATFSGFGFNHGVFNNFNRATIKVGQIVGSSNPVTEVNIRICENDMNGTELARVTKSVTIASGDIQDVTFEFPTIVNAGNVSLWVEFWCNGKTGLFKGGVGSVVNYRYKTIAHTYGDFVVQSLASAGPNYRFYLVLSQVVTAPRLKDNLITDQLTIGNNKPVKAGTVKAEFDKFNYPITDGYAPTSTVIKGNDGVTVATSTFKGWGQLIGVVNNFNRVGYIFRAFDNSAIPTQVRCVIRTVSSTGTIIFDQTKSVSLSFNTSKKIYFDLSSVYANGANEEIFISFFANGMISLVGGVSVTTFDAAHTVKYTTTSLSDTVSTNANNLYQLYCEILNGTAVKQVSDAEVARIRGYDTPDMLLTSTAYLFPGKQFNVYNANVIVPNYGDNLNNYRFNFDASLGKQMLRGYRLDNAPVSMNVNLTLNLMRGREALVQKIQNMVSPTLSNGSGQTRKMCCMGDSLTDNNNITPHIANYFASDVMAIQFVGTRGATGTKHEGRGGWTVNDYYGPGRTLYVINVTGIATPPGLGARYTQAGNVYNVEEINISGGSGYFSVSVVSGFAPTSSGTLTKSSGTGDNSITYASSSTSPGNPFYYATTGMFDLGYYLTSTGQTMGNNDLFMIMLGTNDMFAFTDLGSAQAKVITMMSQLQAIINNIHAYNANIRVCVMVTIPCSDQNAFGESYTTGQLSEMYARTGLVTWQRKIIDTLDNATARAARTYVVPVHQQLDTVNNMPTITQAVNGNNSATETIQSNGVHPKSEGYNDIGLAYAAVAKYFG